jgi:putative ABC transport system permease protein
MRMRMNFKLAVRSLVKSPGFTLLAIAVLGLGIGASTAIFSVINSVLLKPLDFPDSGRLVQVMSLNRRTGNPYSVSGLNFRDWRDQNSVFESMGAFATGKTSVVFGKNTEQLNAAWVSPGFFDALAVAPRLGRLLFEKNLPAAEEHGAVISYRLWQSRFGGNQNVLGQTLKVEGGLYPIAGVLPPRAEHPRLADIWIGTIPENDGASRSGNNYNAIARLKTGVPIEAAAANLDAIARQLTAQYPGDNANVGAAVYSLQERMVFRFRPTLQLLAGAVALLLLIACANVANLLLARAEARRREIAIRLALGAGSRHIFTQIATESLVLGLAGGALGIVLAMWGTEALIALSPPNVPRLDQAAIDGSVLAFAFALSLLTGLLFGLAPLAEVRRADLNQGLKLGGTRTATGGSGAMRSGIVVAEVALSVVLLLGAGLLIKSFSRLLDVETGFDSHHLLAMDTAITATEKQDKIRFFTELANEASRLPGVAAAGVVVTLPSQASGWNGSVMLEGQPMPKPGEFDRLNAGWNMSGPGFFRALGVPLRSGRDFDERDGPNAPEAVIVNETFAKRFWPDQDALGHRFRIGLDTGNWMTVVAVAADFRGQALDQPIQPEIFFPFMQHAGRADRMYLVVRPVADNPSLPSALRQAANRLSPEVAIGFRTMDDVLAESVAAPRFRTLLLSVFAGLALLLAAAGVYGVMSYVVQRRRQEMGIRMALGAGGADVLRLVFTQGMRLVAIGLVLGLAGAFAAGRYLQSILFEVQATDPVSYAGVTGVLFLAATLAIAIPALRAAHADPAVVLRNE